MYKNNISGFTLIELSMVLLIVGLLLAGILTPLATSLEQRKRDEMGTQYDDIEETLIGFAIVNGRLPCPDCPDDSTGTCATGDENDGIEDQSGAGGCDVGATTTIEGNLPWATLGIDGTDPWGNTLQYHVETAYADTLAEVACTPANGTASFSVCTTASITVQDLGGTCTGAPNSVATNVPVVIYSQGNQTATSCNELENTDGNSTFVDTGYNEITATYYDDMITWISPFLLDSRMIKAEVLP
jgi:prepilin-type N-terminal cleavage/methylation domain-containing protein